MEGGVHEEPGIGEAVHEEPTTGGGAENQRSPEIEEEPTRSPEWKEESTSSPESEEEVTTRDSRGGAQKSTRRIPRRIPRGAQNLRSQKAKEEFTKNNERFYNRMRSPRGAQNLRRSPREALNQRSPEVHKEPTTG